MRSPRAVREAIQTGAISLDDLTPDAFEDLIVEIVRTEYGNFGEAANITRDRRYDVDIVVREHKRGPFHPNDEMHFIEAKCYGKSLSLDTTAKAYCAAIRYRPRTLTIACKSAVQPQPLDYGRALFGDGRVTQLFILNLRRALSLEALDPVLGEFPSDVRAPLFRLRSWQIWKRTTFTAELIATSESAPSSVMADNEATYDLIVVADRPNGDSTPEFHLFCESGERVLPKGIESFGEVARIDLPLTSEVISQCHGSTELVAVDGVRQTSETIQLPRFEVEASRFILPDLRREISDYWGRRLMENDGPRVLLLHGEGGIGKTYLCERIAASLHQKTGLRCAHIAVDSATSHLTFLRLILSILFPPNIDRSEGLAFEQEAIQSLFHSLDDDSSSESNVVGNGHAAGGLFGTDLHAQITLAAKLLATYSSSVAIFLSNCQHLTPEFILGLRAFLVALDQFGWNNCRIVCEYRDQPSATNTYLSEFVEAVLTDRIGNAAALEIKEVSTATMLKTVNALFPDSESRSVAASLMKKTAGNPFLLENLLQHYKDKGIIVPTEPTGYRIVDHARFNVIESQVSESVQHLLAERLKHLDSMLEDTFGEPDLASRILGLAALMGTRVDERVWHASGWKESVNRKMQKTFESHAILTRSLDDGSARFSHDLMRAACRERLTQISSGDRMVESALNRIDGDDPSDFVLRGTLHAFLRNEREAMSEFNRGYELAAHGNQDFSMQKRCLIGMSELYGRRPLLDDRDRLMFVEILSNLGWAEHNSGSSAHAADIYQQALDLVEQTGFDSEIWTPAVAWERKAALTHALLGLSLPTLQFDKVVSWARYAIRSSQDFTRLGKILNRLVRLCNLFGYTSAGAQTARLALTLSTASRDPEVLAVLCTDIGDLYLHAEPVASKALRDRGLTEAKERRQQLHNETCAAISDVYAHAQWAPEEPTLQTWSDARSVGVRNVSARLSLYRGAKACADGALDLGRLYFLEAGQIALLSGDLWLQTLANNNLAIISWSEGDEDRANAEASRVVHTVEHIAQEMPPESALLDLVYLAQARAESLRPAPPSLDKGRELPLLERGQTCCGTLNVLLHNLEEFDKIRSVDSMSWLWATRRKIVNSGLAVLRSENHPLVVRHNRRTLVFAVE
jgi:tetratricopeptide (TPR) repeat protein